MKYLIFDLDGTLANCDHRQHHLQKVPADWDSFFLACDKDEPNWPVIHTMTALYGYFFQADPEGYHFLIFSGRSDIARDKTTDWLANHRVPYDHLFLRKQGDYTPDEELKQAWAHEIGVDNILFVFDDRQKVVDMWRENGVTCFQVAPGDF